MHLNVIIAGQCYKRGCGIPTIHQKRHKTWRTLLHGNNSNNNINKSRLSLILRVNVVLNRTVVVDSAWRFDNLCGSHLQSERWLPHRLSKRQALSTTTVLFRTTFTRTIKLNVLFDSEDDYRTGCRNVSHCQQQQQSYSGPRSPGRSNSTYFWNDSWVQTFHNNINNNNISNNGRGGDGEWSDLFLSSLTFILIVEWLSNPLDSFVICFC